MSAAGKSRVLRSMPRVLVALGGMFLITAGASATSAAEAHQRAYHAMTNGQVHEGAVEIIEYLRAMPADDLAAADALVGPAQLLGFSIASLMNWGDRGVLLSEVLDADEYPTDALLIRTMEYGSGIQQYSLVARYHLEQLAQGDHIAVATVAAGILGSGQKFDNTFYQGRAVRHLIANYPELEATRTLVEAPVIPAIREARQSGGGSRPLLRHASRIDGEQARVFQISPGLHRASQALPGMRADGITAGVIGQWADALEEASLSPRDRYTLIALLAVSCQSGEDRAQARSGLEAVAALPPTTPDVVRARSVLASFARSEHDGQGAYDMARGIVDLGVLPTTAERSMYEVMMHTAQHTAEYLTRYGYTNLAIQLHEALANKFPDTVLGRDEAKKAQELRDNGLVASIEAVHHEVNQLIRNAQNMETASPRIASENRAKAEALLNDIIENTPNNGLRANLLARLSRIDYPVPPL